MLDVLEKSGTSAWSISCPNIAECKTPVQQWPWLLARIVGRKDGGLYADSVPLQTPLFQLIEIRLARLLEYPSCLIPRWRLLVWESIWWFAAFPARRVLMWRSESRCRPELLDHEVRNRQWPREPFRQSAGQWDLERFSWCFHEVPGKVNVSSDTLMKMKTSMLFTGWNRPAWVYTIEAAGSGESPQQVVSEPETGWQSSMGWCGFATAIFPPVTGRNSRCC